MLELFFVFCILFLPKNDEQPKYLQLVILVIIFVLSVCRSSVVRSAIVR